MKDYDVISLQKIQKNIDNNPNDFEQKKIFVRMFENVLSKYYENAFMKNDFVYLPIGVDLFQCNESWLYSFFIKNSNIKEKIRQNSFPDEIELFYESQKARNTFIFDEITLSIFLPGSQIPETYQILVYPIKPRQNTQFVYLIKENQKTDFFITPPDTVFSDLWLGDFKFRTSSIFVNNNMDVQINIYSQYEEIGIKCNKTIVRHRSTKRQLTGFGHVCIKGENEYHILPILVNNGNSGLCDIACVKIEKNKQYADKDGIYVFNNVENEKQIDKFKILPYWTDKFFCAEIIGTT